MLGRQGDKPLLNKKSIIIALLVSLAGTALAESQGSAQSENTNTTKVTEAHFRVHRADGRVATLADIAEAMADYDAVLLGENHDDPAAHYIEAELLRLAAERYTSSSNETTAGTSQNDLSSKRRAVVLSLEMFERDVQTMVDEYLAGLITEEHFTKSARAWPYYKSDYRPMVEYAKQHRLPVIAANAPRRYVNLVSRMGGESLARLSPQARAWLPPLPYGEASKAYAEKFRGVMGHLERPSPTEEKRPDNGSSSSAASQTERPAQDEEAKKARFERGLASQSLWDASMAHAIAGQLKKDSRALVIHVNGRFHSEERMGIPDHLARYRKGARALIVTMLSDKGFPNFDSSKHARLGDFIIITDPTLPRPSRSNR
ncbi:MAG: ChaN family lipoprotein [Blastocatellia bacterium]|nr:ChaN family lipoprotein [Blastocatellia bacterium]